MRALRVSLVVCLAMLALLSGVLFGPRLKRAFGLERADSPAVVSEIQRLNQLVTVRYSIQRVVGVKEPKEPVGEESLLLMVQGEVQAGVDLAHFDSANIHFSGPHAVVVLLPPPQIVNVFLDEKYTKVWDRRITWWTPWVGYDPDLEHKARQQALEDVKSAALSMGILQQAQRNAEWTVRDFLEALHLAPTVKTGVS
jgi:uncharacterized protein DUF4230